MSINKWWHTPFSEVHAEALQDTFNSRQITYGDVTKNFEESFASLYGKKFAVAVNSGTSAILCSLLAIGIEEGDEVIVPAIGWIATPQAILAAGAVPKFVDVETDRPVLSIEKLQEAISPRTKAIVVVHYNGRIVDTAKIRELWPNIPVIEDTCKAMFSGLKDKFAGSVGTVGCFSLGMISLISGGYGGIAITDDEKVASKLKIARWHGVSTEGKIHEQNERYELRSFNCKPSDLFFSLAAVSLSEVEERKRNLINLYNRYREEISQLLDEDLKMVEVDIQANELPLLIDLNSTYSTNLMRCLHDNGIETCRYHPPLNLGAYLNATDTQELPNSNYFAYNTFHLPSGIFRKDLNLEYFERLKNSLAQFKTEFMR